MGAVYVAEDLVLHRRVAIKFPSQTDDQDNHAMFLREARLASSLSSPHIATVFDFGVTEKNEPFIVMELVNGENLAKVINEGPVSLSKCLSIVLDIARALKDAHSHGVIHRDIKPANIILGMQGGLKVLDFGLAKRFHISELSKPADDAGLTSDLTLSQRGSIRGTPRYMSPEQIRGEDLDGTSDIFALGIVFYELLTGVPPFSGGDAGGIANSILFTQPIPPSRVNPTISAEIDRIVLRCLTKDRRLRYQKSAELIADLLSVEREVRDASTQHFIETPNRVAQPNVLGAASSDTPLPTSALDASTVPWQELKARTRRDGFVSFIRSHLIALRRPTVAIGILGSVAVAIAAITYLLYWNGGNSTSRSAEAQHFFDQGLFALRDGSHLKARNLFERAIKVDDGWALAHARLAETWIELDNMDASSREITAAHARASKDRASGPSDALYLNAITQLSDLNYSEAVKGYEKITGTAPSDAYVHFDLAKAYEKNSKVKQAIDEHLKALELNDGLAASHLRLGILYARSGDLVKGEERFKKAESTYDISINGEGKTEVILQRGIAYLAARKLDLAKQELQLALNRAEGPHANPYQAIRARIQLSTVAARENDLVEAEKLAMEAFAIATREGIESLTMRGRISLGDVYLRQNKYGKALKFTEEGKGLAERYRVKRFAMLASMNLGGIRIAQNLNDEGIELVRPSMMFFESSDFKTQATDCRKLIARALLNKGNYDEALRIFNELQAADEIAMLRFEREQYPEALVAFEASVKQDVAGGDKESEFYDRLNYARSLAMLGYTAKAEEQLRLASSLAKSDTLKRSLVHPQAELALIRNDAKTAARLAISRLEGTDAEDYVAILEAKQLLCRSEPRACDEALALVRKMSSPKTVAFTKMLAARSLLVAGRAGDAVQTAREAASEFERLGLLDSLWRSLGVVAEASAKSGDMSRARESAIRSRSFLNSLKQTWSRADFESYALRPDVTSERRQVDALIASSFMEKQGR